MNTPNIRFKGYTDAWEQRKLGEIAEEILAGGDIDKTKAVESGVYPIYANALTNDGVVGYYNDYYRVKAPAVTVTGRGEVGHAKARMADFTPVVRLLAIRSNHDSYFLENAINLHPVMMESTGVPQLTVPQLSAYNIKVPKDIEEEKRIGEYFNNLDNLIALHQRKCDDLQEVKKYMLQKLFPLNGAKIPEIRFAGFTGEWEPRKFGEIYEKVSQKNDMTYGTEDIISVANMYYKPDASVKNEDYLKTYNIFNLGDIAFEGNKSKNYAHGRFVENTIGNGIVSHVFDVFRPIAEFDLSFWKYLINYEGVMGPILTRVTKASTMMTNLVAKDFLNEEIRVPKLEEQMKIGKYLDSLDELIVLQQRNVVKLKEFKKYMLKNMFPEG